MNSKAVLNGPARSIVHAVLFLLMSLASAQSDLVTFQFSGTFDRASGDLSSFPGTFGVGSSFRGMMTFDTTVNDFDPQTDQVGLFLLPSPPSAFKVSVTDLLGMTYDFVAAKPFVLIYDNLTDVSRVDAGSDHFTAYGRDFGFRLSFYDNTHSIISTDQLQDFVPGAGWDQIEYELSTGTGVPSVIGHAAVVPEPSPLLVLFLGAWSLTLRKANQGAA